MRAKGKVTHWNEEKGYGFITPSTGAKQVFTHITAFRDRGGPPTVNEMVEFSLSTDRQGRPCAVRVTKVGENVAGGIRRNDRQLYTAGAVAFLVVVALSVIADAMPTAVLAGYLAVSLVTYIVYYWDKSAARTGSWRTQESTLHTLSLLGGWPGALIAQQMLRHKSRKASFRLVFWLTMILNCGIYAWLFTPAGVDFLRGILNLA